MKKFVGILEFVAKMLVSILMVDVAVAVYDYCNNGYWVWTEVPNLVLGYVVVVGAAYVGFNIDRIIGAISGTHKKVKKPQFVVYKNGDLEGL